MAYKTEELEKKAVAAIEKHRLIFIEEVVSFLPCSKSTFYAKKLDESDAIKNAILAVKIGGKSNLRQKWEESDSAPLNIALYKLYATEEELQKLTTSNNKTEIKKVNADESKTIEELEKELEDLGLQRTDKEGEADN